MIIALFGFLIYQFFQIRDLEKETALLKKELNSARVLAFEDGRLKLIRKIDTKKLYFDKSYIEIIGKYSSPFGDNKTLEYLIKKYVRSYKKDKYGAARATGIYARVHEGIDISVPKNTPLFPLGEIGIITGVSYNPSTFLKIKGRDGRGKEVLVDVDYGKYVKILYPEGIESVYAHLSEVLVEEGNVVYGGSIVGRTGYTGNIKRSGKPSHLHLELKFAGESLDPESRLKFTKKDIDKFIGKYEGLR